MGTRQDPLSFWIKSTSCLASVVVPNRVGCVLAVPVLFIGGGLGLPLHDG